MEEVKRIVAKSEIIEEDDSKWPEPNADGRQELEILLDNKHIFFTVSDAAYSWWVVLDHQYDGWYPEECGSWGTSRVLLLGTGSEVLGHLHHLAPLQD